MKSGPPASAASGAARTARVAHIKVENLVRTAHLPPFDPLVADGAAHEREQRVGVDRTLLRREQALVVVVEQALVDGDAGEETEVLALARRAAGADAELALVEAGGGPQAGQAGGRVEEEDHVLVGAVGGPAARRDAEVGLAVDAAGLEQAELAEGVLARDGALDGLLDLDLDLRIGQVVLVEAVRDLDDVAAKNDLGVGDEVHDVRPRRDRVRTGDGRAE